MSVQPPGWPQDLRPPGSDDFEERAVLWLLDRLPPDVRTQPGLRNHPLALALLCHLQATATLEATREAYRSARVELGEHLAPAEVAEVLEALQARGAAATRELREAGLVQQALQGHRWTPRL